MSTRRAVRLYYAYRVTTSIGFYIPVGVVFLAEVKGFGPDAIGVVMAAYLVAMLVAEIPTGYLGDRVGRRASLAVGNTLMAGSLLAWAFLSTFVAYAALFCGLFQVALAFEQFAAREVGIPVAGLGLLCAGFKLVSAGPVAAGAGGVLRLAVSPVRPLGATADAATAAAGD